MEERLVARIEAVEAPQRGYWLRSPAVGIVEGLPEMGTHLRPLTGFATLRVLNRPLRVQLPVGVEGFVAERFVAEGRTPVEYNQPLLRIALLAAEAIAPEASVVSGASGAGEAPVDVVTVTAPSEGIFYLRPKPDAPAYVSVGSAVSTGAVLGLVEVMKCFNPITYGGPGLPASGVVAEILVRDASEVKHGQPLFRVKPGG